MAAGEKALGKAVLIVIDETGKMEACEAVPPDPAGRVRAALPAARRP